MPSKKKVWRTISVLLVGGSMSLALIWGLFLWKDPQSTPALPAPYPFQGTQAAEPTVHPFTELLKLAVAAVIGLVVTAVHKRFGRDKAVSRSLEHAQILLCVAGAMMMILIGNSVARAFGIAGAASIIRFRTPVEDPKDTTVLFLMVALGMACGVGALPVAALGTIFLCLFLFILDYIGTEKPRAMMLELVAEGEFPTAHVLSVFSRYSIPFERREVWQDEDEATVKYHVMVASDTSLDDLSAQLISGGASGIKSVSWKKSG